MWTRRRNNSYHRNFLSPEKVRDNSRNQSSWDDCNKKKEWTEKRSKSEERSELCK